MVFTPKTLLCHTGSCHTPEKQILEGGLIRFMERELSQLPSTLGVEESGGEGGPALSTELDPKAPVSPKRCMCY